MKTLIFHLLLLLLIPILWQIFKEHRSATAGKPALPVLANADQEYYDTVFSYAMETLPDDGSYPWQEANAAGAITAGKSFISLSHSFCRPYGESYTINGISGTREGKACRRKNNDTTASWCKLRNSDMLSCALETPSGPLEKLFHDGNDATSRIPPFLNR